MFVPQMFDRVCPFLNVDLHLEKQLRDLPPGAELWSHLSGGKVKAFVITRLHFLNNIMLFPRVLLPL